MLLLISGVEPDPGPPRGRTGREGRSNINSSSSNSDRNSETNNSSNTNSNNSSTGPFNALDREPMPELAELAITRSLDGDHAARTEGARESAFQRSLQVLTPRRNLRV